MIRVNLLEGTAEQRVSVQKTRAAAKHGQQIFMLVAALLIAFVAVREGLETWRGEGCCVEGRNLDPAAAVCEDDCCADG